MLTNSITTNKQIPQREKICAFCGKGSRIHCHACGKRMCNEWSCRKIHRQEHKRAAVFSTTYAPATRRDALDTTAVPPASPSLSDIVVVRFRHAHSEPSISAKAGEILEVSRERAEQLNGCVEILETVSWGAANG